ncbi:box C/D snoRNA protein 1-like [Oppia nitens]|uniref:box C/D snoRNA protein 1-like n=1 Tax=Oppia nitens TaxID=1686743 RepID=UPI0023DC9FED|nr:box C/D snoRNA protein 1-like [Oppia nitens]
MTTNEAIGNMFGLFGCDDQPSDKTFDGYNGTEEVTQSNICVQLMPDNHKKATEEAIDDNKCVICSNITIKYRCPKCQLKTCSLICCKSHKSRFNCDGIRDKTPYIKISEFTQQDFLSDYFFLEDVDQTLDNNCRQRRAIINSKQIMPKWLQKLSKEARNRGTNLKIMPGGFTRRKQNTTCFMYNDNTINWDIELKFIHAIDSKDLKNLDQLLAEDLVISHSEFSCTERRINENTSLSTILTKYIGDNDLIDNYDKNRKLMLYRMLGLDGISVLFRKEKCGLKNNKYYEIDLNKSIKDNLFRRLVIEFPTFLVILNKFKYLFDICDDKH